MRRGTAGEARLHGTERPWGRQPQAPRLPWPASQAGRKRRRLHSKEQPWGRQPQAPHPPRSASQAGKKRRCLHSEERPWVASLSPHILHGQPRRRCRLHGEEQPWRRQSPELGGGGAVYTARSGFGDASLLGCGLSLLLLGLCHGPRGDGLCLWSRHSGPHCSGQGQGLCSTLLTCCSPGVAPGDVLGSGGHAGGQAGPADGFPVAP